MRRLIQLFSALTALVSPLHADFALTAGVSTYSPQCQQSDVPGAPVSIRRRDRALYLRYRPPGQQRQVEEHFSRLKGESMKAYRARAEAELEKVTLGLAAGTRTAPTSRTVEELEASFLAAVRSEIKTRTYETYESRIRNYIVPALGSKKVAHLATEDIRTFKRYLLSFKVVGNRTMAVSTILSTTRWTGKTAGNTGGLHLIRGLAGGSTGRTNGRGRHQIPTYPTPSRRHAGLSWRRLRRFGHRFCAQYC